MKRSDSKGITDVKIVGVDYYGEEKILPRFSLRRGEEKKIPPRPFEEVKKVKLESVRKLMVSKKVVIPAKAGIQFFQGLLDAGSSPA